jgi:hypothetical protein
MPGWNECLLENTEHASLAWRNVLPQVDAAMLSLALGQKTGLKLGQPFC